VRSERTAEDADRAAEDAEEAGWATTPWSLEGEFDKEGNDNETAEAERERE